MRIKKLILFISMGLIIALTPCLLTGSMSIDYSFLAPADYFIRATTFVIGTLVIGKGINDYIDD